MQSKLFSIYGGRVSKSGKRLNLSIVSGEGENKEFATISVLLKGKGSTTAQIKDGFGFIKFKMLVSDKKEEKSEDVSF